MNALAIAPCGNLPVLPRTLAGAHLLPAGGVAFTLWAPDQASHQSSKQASKQAPQLELLDLLDDGSVCVRESMAMQSVPGDAGWLQCSVPEAHAGTLYRYRFADGLTAADPASRCNPLGVHGPSQVVDSAALRDTPAPAWQGRPWHEAVLYELHIGTFTPQGTLAAAALRLPALQALGITAIELMPVAAFAGNRGWGYDGVLHYAVHAAYGRPEDLRAFVDTAHGLGLMVLLDVVYNHFGPDGNYLAAWCPGFFDADIHTPWGPAIRFDQPAVRSFYVHNALHWVDTYGLDGLRLDAVHAIHDRHGATHIVEDIASALQAGPGRSRQVHLVLENDDNTASLLARDASGRPLVATAQWNDDWHHAAHTLACGETQGYYADYHDAADPAAPLARALAEGFVYQGQPSRCRNGAARGEPSGSLPSTAFIALLQNHDQVGNRAFGERLDALAPSARIEALLVCLLLSPQVPMLFMGEEFAARTPFLYFCEFDATLGAAVARGRRAEFAAFPAFTDAAVRETIPDPNAPATFDASRLHWPDADTPAGQRRLALVRQLLALRQAHLMPLLARQRHGGQGRSEAEVVSVDWPLGAATWRLRANFSGQTVLLAVSAGEQQVCAHRAERSTAEVLQLQNDGVFISLLNA